jgi:ssDNA-binding Zn-finger/Zn-ribbon topoisomerase 1
MYISKEKYKYILNLSKGEKTGLKCDGCGADLVIREGHSKFLGCSNYPKCKCHYSLENAVEVGTKAEVNLHHLDHSFFKDTKFINWDAGLIDSPDFDIDDWTDENIAPILCKDDIYNG